jgi:hypothetical protein
MPNDKTATMQCPHCEGSGIAPLPKPLLQTVQALGSESLGMTEMMHRMKITSQLANYRLSRLLKLGVLQKVAVDGRPKYRLAVRRPKSKPRKVA